MKRRKPSLWFVRPNDSHTNDVLAGMLYDDEAFMRKKDKSGTPQPVWQCTFNQLRNLQASRTSKELRFTVFTASTQHLPIHQYEHPFARPKKPAATTATAQVAV